MTRTLIGIVFCLIICVICYLYLSKRIVMRRDWQYLKYVLRHKWWVAYYGWQLRLPFLILIFHDWDKFLPDEWVPYARTFYKPDGSNQYEPNADFTKAWLLHQNRNKHHWQFWMITWDKGNTECLPMPDVYRREMLADWHGAGRAITGKENTLSWYLDNYDFIQLHPETRAWINWKLAEASSEQGINDGHLLKAHLVKLAKG